ncbi:MAG TPA: FKBP-type peptidyl-prolyl cis-trans isomerase [Chthoniobacterales bacterium]|jgi:FKBP-type peptidyl-prolyl cis-trans isomerase
MVKSFSVKVSVFILALGLLGVPLGFTSEPELKDQKSQLSYVVGLQTGQLIKNRQIEVNEKLVEAGIRDALSGRTPRLTEGEVKSLLASIDTNFLERRAADRKAAGERNEAEGPKFLAQNKNKEGVITTSSGLQYKILHEGNGAMPREADRVVVNFIGMTIDGKEFENTYDSGHAETIPVDRMIMGWREALLLMKSGSKYRLFVPPELAFGARGAGAIAPNATLIFDLELLGVVPEPSAPSKAHDTPQASVSPKSS